MPIFLNYNFGYNLLPAYINIKAPWASVISDYETLVESNYFQPVRLGWLEIVNGVSHMEYFPSETKSNLISQDLQSRRTYPVLIVVEAPQESINITYDINDETTVASSSYLPENIEERLNELDLSNKEALEKEKRLNELHLAEKELKIFLEKLEDEEEDEELKEEMKA